ncbi:hypothetical protein Tco_1021511 [Tanacetum coccineum]
MRTKRNQKIPNSKKTASKKSRGSLENQKVNCKEKGVNGECISYGNTENGECGREMRDKGEEPNVNEGFIGDLNGEQFPPTNGEGKKLVDIVNASKLDNKLLKIPTEVSENGNEVVIFDYELIELVPMEAWSVKGIRALSSSLGKQVIMDEVTTRMCLTGVGRIGFSIVLMEIGADKEIKDKIEIIYKSKNVTKGTKKVVDVKYAWRPCICTHCNVFGHEVQNCRVKNKYEHNIGTEQISVNGFKGVQNRKIRNEGFDQNRKIHVQNGYNGRMWNAGRYSKENNKRQTKSRFDYRKIMKGEKTDNEIGGKGNKMNDNIGRNTKHNEENVGKTKMQEAKNNNISVGKGKMKESLDKSNRFTLLDSLVYEDELVPDLNEIKTVDKYNKDRKEIIDAMDYMSSDDVVEEVNVEGNSCLMNEVDGGRGNIRA